MSARFIAAKSNLELDVKLTVLVVLLQHYLPKMHPLKSARCKIGCI